MLLLLEEGDFSEEIMYGAKTFSEDKNVGPRYFRRKKYLGAKNFSKKGELRFFSRKRIVVRDCALPPGQFH